MQKRDLKGSILIWSIFLSLIISLSFVYVSTKVNQNIRLNNTLDEEMEKNTNISKKISDGILGDIGDNEFLSYEQNIYTMKNKENLTFTFSGNTNFSGSIVLKNGGPIYYDIISYSGSVQYGIVSSGVISNPNRVSFTGILNNQYNLAVLSVNNLAGNSSFLLDSNLSYSGFIAKYKVTKNIGGKNIEKKVFVK